MADGILAAHDLTDRCRPVTAAAARLAEQLGMPLAVLHVMPRDELEEERDRRSPEGAYLDVVVADVQTQLRDMVAEEIPDGPGAGLSFRVLVDDPHTAIVKHLEDHDFEYAFVGVKNRSRVGKLVFGSVVQSVLLRTPTKVVAVPLDS